MFTKSISKTGKIWLFICIEIFCISFIGEARNSIEEIVKLAEEERVLNKKIVERMVFSLSEEQLPIAGDNEKYILKDTKNNLWVFKPDSKGEVKKAKMVSDMAHLLGINIPVIDGITLPINKKEVFGSILEIGSNNIFSFEEISMKDLSPKKISSLQKLQVLDWLLIAPSGEMEEHCFIISERNDNVLGIDKDDCFQNIRDGRILGLETTDWEGTIYNSFWGSYVNGEINVDFREVFELINYIQHLENEEFNKILHFLNGKNKKKFLEEVIWRKDNLRSEFEKFYNILEEKRGKELHLPLKGDYKNYLKNLLKKKKEQIVSKKLEYKWLINQGRKKQPDINVVSARAVWILISMWLKKNCEKIITVQEIIGKSQMLKTSSFFVGEHLAIELYLRQLKTRQKLNIYRIIKDPKMVDPIEIEYNLRVNNYDIFLSTNSRELSIIKKRRSIISHFRYIGIMKAEKREEQLISEYEEQIKKNPNNQMYLFLGLMAKVEYCFNTRLNRLEIDNSGTFRSCLDKLDVQFPWKYYGLALCDYGAGYIEQGIKECEKILELNNDKEPMYAAYMLLGFFYEHNNNIRFGRGFDVEKSIIQYKKALKVKSNSVETHLNLGNLYLIKNSPADALKEFKKIQKLSPLYARLHLPIENIRKKSFYKNEVDYLKAIRMNTLTGEDHYILGLAWAVKKNYKKAKEHFDKAKEFGYINKTESQYNP